MRLSVLDLSPVSNGSSGKEALHNTLDLAKLVDRLGYTRYWLAEHHNSPGIASSSPEIMIAAVADATQNLRVGSGGIMLPNHAPLKVAESFKVLEALHSGRIDLGLGRAPGTDWRTAQALRRQDAVGDSFPQALRELLAFLGPGFPDQDPYHGMIAVPEDGASPQVWILSSSGYGAQVAAHLGLGLAFAHHINPLPAVAALRQYREQFRPSGSLAQAASILAVAVVCAPTQEEAEVLASSFDLVRLRLEQGRLGKFPSVSEAQNYPYEAFEQQRILENRNRFFVGTPELLKTQLTQLASEAGVEELMILTLCHDHQARRTSYELLAKAFQLKVPQ